VSGAGPEDLRDLADASPVQEFMGGTLDDVPQNYDDASPMFHVRAGAPPFLFVHGTNDWFVPIAHSRDMAAELREVGTDARMLEVPGGGHIWNDAGGDWEVPLTSIDTPAAQAAIIDFLDDTIGPVP
jgi:acetyl esterase/lipase